MQSDAAPPGSGDNYITRVVKYIPAEVVALYLTLQGLLGAANQAEGVAAWCVLGGCLVGCVLYLRRLSGVKHWSQITVSGLGFLAWAFALGGPFKTFSWYLPVYGACVVAFFTFLVPLVDVSRSSGGQGAAH